MTISENESELFVEILHKTYANKKTFDYISHGLTTSCLPFGRKHNQPACKFIKFGNDMACIYAASDHMDSRKHHSQYSFVDDVANVEKIGRVYKRTYIPSTDSESSSSNYLSLRLKYPKDTQTYAHSAVCTIIYNNANLSALLNTTSILVVGTTDIDASFPDNQQIQIECLYVKRDIWESIVFTEELMLSNVKQYYSKCYCTRLKTVSQPQCLNVEFNCSTNVNYERNTSGITFKRWCNKPDVANPGEFFVYDDSVVVWSKQKDHITDWILSQDGDVINFSQSDVDQLCTGVNNIAVPNSDLSIDSFPVLFERSSSMKGTPKEKELAWISTQLFAFDSQSLNKQWSQVSKPVPATFRTYQCSILKDSQNSLTIEIPRLLIHNPKTDFLWVVKKFVPNHLGDYSQFVSWDTTNSNRQDVSKRVTFAHGCASEDSPYRYFFCNNEDKRQPMERTSHCLAECEQNIGMQASLIDSANELTKSTLLGCPPKGCFTFHTEIGKIFTYLPSTRIRRTGYLLKYSCEMRRFKEMEFCVSIRSIERLVSPACVQRGEPDYTIMNHTWMCKQLPLAFCSSSSMNRNNVAVSKINSGIGLTENSILLSLHSNRNHLRSDTYSAGGHFVWTTGFGAQQDQKTEKIKECLLSSKSKYMCSKEDAKVQTFPATERFRRNDVVHPDVKHAPGYFDGFGVEENSIDHFMKQRKMQTLCTVELNSVSPVKMSEKLSILSNVDDIRSSDVFHEHSVDERMQSVKLRNVKMKQRDGRTTELENTTHVMKQTPSLRPSQGSSGTFWNDDIEDDDSKFRPNCSSQPNSVQKCGDGLNSQTSLYPSAVTRDRKHDHDNEPTGPPPVSKHSSAEISGLRKATGSASSSPETRNSSSSGEAEEEDNLNQKKKKNKRNSVKELLKRYERLTSKLIKTNQCITALYDEKQQKGRRTNRKQTAESTHDEDSSEAFSDRQKQTETVAVLKYLNRLRDQLLQTYGDALSTNPSQKNDEHSKKDVAHKPDIEYLKSLFDKPVVQPSVPHSVSSAPDISIKRNYSECLPAAFPNQRFGQQSVDPRLAYPAAPDSLQNMITLSNPSTGFYLPGTCAPVQSTYLTSSLPPTSIGEPISRSQSRSRHTSSRRSSRSVLDDDRRSRHRSRSRRKLIVEKLHPSAQSGASCVRMSTTYNCPHRNKLPSNCCMTMIPSTSNNYLNSHIPASCLCPHSCPAWSSTMECCPHHPHPYLESTPTRPTVLQQSTRWPHGTVWPITYHSPCPVRENSQQAYNYSQPVSHLQSVQQNSKMLPPFPPPYQIPADLSQTQQTTQVAAPNQTVSPMIRLPSAIAHPNTYPQTAHPPTPSLGHHPNLSHVPIRQTAAPHQLAQATFAHPPIAYYGNPAPGSPNHSLQFGGFQKEINSRMHADLEPRNYVHQKNHEKEVSAIQPGRASFHAPAQSDLMSASENQPKQFEHGGSKFVHNVTLNPNEVLSIPATRKEGVLDNVRIHIPRQIIPEKDHPTNSSVPNTMKTGTLSPQTHHHHHHQQQQQQQQQHQQQQQMPKESQISPAPFRSVIARRANLLAEPSTPEDWKKVEQRFDQLQREKTMLESKLCRLPPRGNYSKPSVVAEEERINDDLSRVEKEMSALRLLMHRRFVENRRLRSKAN